MSASKSSRNATEPTPIDQTREHLRSAAKHAGEAMKSATEAAKGELSSGSEKVRADLSDAGQSSAEAARAARASAEQQMQSALKQGKAQAAKVEELIRNHPLAAFGVALGSGYLLARILRR